MLNLPKFRPGRTIFGGDQAQERPLNICTACKYMLCGCGSCHSQECGEPCQYSAEESAQLTQANVEMSEHLRSLLASRLD